MPPVLGPVSPSPHPLEVLGPGQGHGPAAVADGHDRQLVADQPLLDHHPAAGVTEGGPGQLGPDVVDGLVERNR